MERKSWKNVNGRSDGLHYKDNNNQVCVCECGGVCVGVRECVYVCVLKPLLFLQSCDTELLLPRDAVSFPLQPVVVVKREAAPSPISFVGALRIPVRTAHAPAPPAGGVHPRVGFLL